MARAFELNTVRFCFGLGVMAPEELPVAMAATGPAENPVAENPVGEKKGEL